MFWQGIQLQVGGRRERKLILIWYIKELGEQAEINQKQKELFFLMKCIMASFVFLGIGWQQGKSF